MGLDNPLHIAFLVVILLLVFGARRLPEIGRSLGSGMREFKDSITGDSGSAAKGPQTTITPTTQAPSAVVQQPTAAEPATPVGVEATPSGPSQPA
jgi:sec-independent protein translocase protein TatA